MCYHGDCVRALAGHCPRLVLGLDPAWAAALPARARGSGSTSWSRGRGTGEPGWGAGHLCPQQEEALCCGKEMERGGSSVQG